MAQDKTNLSSHSSGGQKSKMCQRSKVSVGGVFPCLLQLRGLQALPGRGHTPPAPVSVFTGGLVLIRCVPCPRPSIPRFVSHQRRPRAGGVVPIAQRGRARPSSRQSFCCGVPEPRDGPSRVRKGALWLAGLLGKFSGAGAAELGCLHGGVQDEPWGEVVTPVAFPIVQVGQLRLPERGSGVSGIPQRGCGKVGIRTQLPLTPELSGTGTLSASPFPSTWASYDQERVLRPLEGSARSVAASSQTSIPDSRKPVFSPRSPRDPTARAGSWHRLLLTLEGSLSPRVKAAHWPWSSSPTSTPAQHAGLLLGPPPQLHPRPQALPLRPLLRLFLV